MFVNRVCGDGSYRSASRPCNNKYCTPPDDLPTGFAPSKPLKSNFFQKRTRDRREDLDMNEQQTAFIALYFIYAGVVLVFHTTILLYPFRYVSCTSNAVFSPPQLTSFLVNEPDS